MTEYVLLNVKTLINIVEIIKLINEKIVVTVQRMFEHVLDHAEIEL
jgi:hypothetical protein